MAARRRSSSRVAATTRPHSRSVCRRLRERPPPASSELAGRPPWLGDERPLAGLPHLFHLGVAGDIAEAHPAGVPSATRRGELGRAIGDAGGLHLSVGLRNAAAPSAGDGRRSSASATARHAAGPRPRCRLRWIRRAPYVDGDQQIVDRGVARRQRARPAAGRLHRTWNPLAGEPGIEPTAGVELFNSSSVISPTRPRPSVVRSTVSS